MNEKMNTADIFLSIKEYFSPKIIGEINDVYVKLVKVKGQDIPWHTHKNEDELFYVIKGELTIQLKDNKDIILNEGELYIVKKGTEHRIWSEEECLLMLIENKMTQHTGDVQAPITKSIEQQHY